MNDEAAVRLEKLEREKALGIEPFPARVRREMTVREYLDRFEELEGSGTATILAGRVRTVRTHGGLTFANLEDGSDKVQLVLRRDEIGTESYSRFAEVVDIGDFLSVKGKPFVTKVGERSLDVAEWTPIAKALLPLPEKWHGLSDVETRYRQRYLDLIANPEVRAVFRTRSAIVAAVRRFLEDRGFMEVETPNLHAIPGGASARPFVTHHNALDVDLYLRVAPELHLKRLVVGGFERVYEIGRCFRNEGIDYLHNPEFTSVEFYQAYADYGDLMVMVEEMLPELARAAGKDPTAVKYGDDVLNLTGPYKRISYRDAVLEATGVDLDKTRDRAALEKEAKRLGVEVAKTDSVGTIMDSIFKKKVRPDIIQPTFLIDYPIELSPLAKSKPEDPRYVERFQLLMARGYELMNAFSELNDPLDQEARFREQAAAHEAGDEEAQRMDTDFVEALKHGMPPTAGLGMGIDRLVMLLTDNHSIKEVILFPTLRPEQAEAGE